MIAELQLNQELILLHSPDGSIRLEDARTYEVPEEDTILAHPVNAATLRMPCNGTSSPQKVEEAIKALTPPKTRDPRSKEIDAFMKSAFNIGGDGRTATEGYLNIENIPTTVLRPAMHHGWLETLPDQNPYSARLTAKGKKDLGLI